MKKLWVVFFVSFVLVSNSWASTYTGSLSLSDGTLIFGGGWSDAVFSWTVDDQTNPGYWTYDYHWTTTTNDLSHIDIEVSENFDVNTDLISWNSSDPLASMSGPQTFVEKYGSIYGIKWELDMDTSDFNLSLISTRMPMWGDIYAKDGDGGDVYAKNLKFGIDTADPIGSGNNGGWALVPDTAVPIPGAVWLLGSGLIGIVGIRKKIKQ